MPLIVGLMRRACLEQILRATPTEISNGNHTVSRLFITFELVSRYRRVKSFKLPQTAIISYSACMAVYLAYFTQRAFSGFPPAHLLHALALSS